MWAVAGFPAAAHMGIAMSGLTLLITLTAFPPVKPEVNRLWQTLMHQAFESVNSDEPRKRHEPRQPAAPIR
ncbi:hypothetical protein GCM10009715_35470 [Paeniglutamicibacter psychrophenolicus]|uniref:Uncharacterized protein n=1 Tax=Paeniglutamicibacter psychrophenolicus TaxID=257454 RepID=A0ABS4WAA1_9MICC|nr:hypothetical protein [Paeniglutamicibacter psychrophenolicus]